VIFWYDGRNEDSVRRSVSRIREIDPDASPVITARLDAEDMKYIDEMVSGGKVRSREEAVEYAVRKLREAE
jgi:hypothetical protein